MATINSIGTGYPLDIEDGGTDTNTLTDHGILLGSGTGAITATSVLTNGQLLIGSTGADPVPGSISSSGGTINITTGAGTLNLETSAGLQIITGFESWDGGAPYFDDTTLGSFTLSQGGSGYIKSKRITWSGGQTVTGLTAGNTYLIYIDDTGTIGKTTTVSLSTYQDYIVLFECLRDSTTPTNNQVTVKENHPYEFPVDTSVYLHLTVGTIIENGSNGANITLNGTNKIEIVGADALSDHGLYTTIPDSGGVAETFVQMYTDASGKWARYALSDTFTAVYNNAGTVTALSPNKYGVFTLYVSKDNLNSSSPTFGAVIDTTQYNSLNAANAAIANGSVAKVSNEVNVLENAQLGYIIIYEATGNIVDVIIEKATLQEQYSTAGSNQASLIITSVTNFDGILSSSDTTVQQALETIDDWGKSTTDHAVLIGNGTGVAIGSLAVGATGETLMGSTAADPGWTGSPSFSGSVTAGTGLTVTTGDVAISSGNLTLPTTTSTTGQIKFGGDTIMHIYGAATDFNIFIGESAGNYTLTTSTAKYNVGIGYNSIVSTTSGSRNVMLGTSSGDSISTGSYNTALGNAVLSGTFNTGSYNVCVGNLAGYNYTGSESSNVLISNSGTAAESNTIRLGTQGSGNGQQDKCYVAGIYGVTPSGGNDGVVIIDSNGQLGSTTSPATYLSINAQTGTSYEIVLADASKLITLTNAAAIDLEIPLNSTTAFPTGTQIVFQQGGAGTVTVAPAVGVTVNSADGLLDTYAQYSVASLIKTGTDTWQLFGDLA